IPVVSHYVIIPLNKLRHLRIKPLEVQILKVVMIVAAKFVQGLGYLRLLRRHHVLPDAAIVKRHLRLERTIGVDAVAGVNKEIEVQLTHRFEDSHTAPIEVDAPTLSDGI